MRQLRLIFRVLLILGCAAVMVVVVTGMLASERELARSRADYRQSVAYLENVSGDLKNQEERLENLTTSLTAVEREVRHELQMVRPGESLVLIEREGARQ